MSEILHRIKNWQLEARKFRHTATAASLTTLMGDIESKAKIEGKPATDETVTAIVKKFVGNARETARIATEHGNETAAKLANDEVAIFESLLPTQLTEAELKVKIAEIITPVPGQVVAKPTIGTVMAALKTQCGGTYDGALASKLIKEALA